MVRQEAARSQEPDRLHRCPTHLITTPAESPLPSTR
jgi:hypothetical protein